jgi:hypothetical protein
MARQAEGPECSKRYAGIPCAAAAAPPLLAARRTCVVRMLPRLRPSASHLDEKSQPDSQALATWRSRAARRAAGRPAARASSSARDSGRGWSQAA